MSPTPYGSIRGRRLVLVGTLAVWLIPVGASQAETHALVVGIDRYRNIRSLQGSVADANDIGNALKKRGVRNLTLLLDAEASRDRILGTLDRIVQQAKRDDLVIVTFAGHGGREQWGQVRPPGIPAGNPREVFLLSDVNLPNVEGTIDERLGGSARERIAGAEMNARLGALHAKGVRTIFVADTCHGGGLVGERKALLSTNAISYRYIPPYSIGDKADPLAAVLGALPEPVDMDKAFPDLTFLAAVERTHQSPEVPIPKGSNTRRGALSYAFARVIDGSAMLGQSGAITRGELVDYVNLTIRTHAENLQEPDLRPRQGFARTVIDPDRDFGPGGSPRPTATASASSTVRLFNSDPSAGAPSFQAGGTVEIVAASSTSEADLILRNGNAYSRSGDLVAARITRDDIRGLAERELASRQLLALSLDRPREIRLRDGDKRYALGERIVVDARRRQAGSEPEHYLLFNIAGTGQVQFLYPRLKLNGFPQDKEDPVLLPTDGPLTQIAATPPIGADMLVLVTSPRPLAGLITDITKLNNHVEPLRAVELVRKVLDDGVRIGIQPIFTGPDG